MATTSAKRQCFTCQKETRTFICEGCSQSFCRTDLTKHLQILNEKFDQIEYNHDQFREKLLSQKDDPNKRPLIQQINHWKEESIKKIEQTAEQCRESLINYTNEYIIHLENQLNKLAKEIQKIRQENEFNEIDLNHLKEKLTKLEEKLDQPTNVSIQQQSTPFINKISVTTPFRKGNQG
jgi:chromosome segregation ATPase